MLSANQGERHDMGIRAAIILAAGVVLAALSHGGLYVAIPAGGAKDVDSMYRINKFTGSVLYCQERACLAAERVD
jgi:hypothetical protein